MVRYHGAIVRFALLKTFRLALHVFLGLPGEVIQERRAQAERRKLLRQENGCFLVAWCSHHGFSCWIDTYYACK